MNRNESNCNKEEWMEVSSELTQQAYRLKVNILYLTLFVFVFISIYYLLYLFIISIYILFYI